MNPAARVCSNASASICPTTMVQSCPSLSLVDLRPHCHSRQTLVDTLALAVEVRTCRFHPVVFCLHWLCGCEHDLGLKRKP